MTSIELTSAWVTIIPSLKGATKQIQDQLAGVDTSAVGSKLGSQLTSGITSGVNLEPIAKKFESIGGSISGVGDKLTSGITKPAVGAATVVGSLVTALGFKRLIGLDNAKAQLKGLGYSADEAAGIINGPVLDAVRGTAFGIADAGLAASGALAAGIKPGQELARHLKMVGDAAAFSGADFGHMASMLTEVEANGYASGGALQQMTENGLFATSMLSESLGISQEEVKKLASEGNISADMLKDALEGKIGGAALSMGETFQGSFANMTAALGRFGAEVWKDVFPKLRTSFAELTTLLDSPEFAQAASSMGEVLTGTFDGIVTGIKTAVTWWNSLSPAMQKNVGILAAVAVSAGPVLKVLGAITTGIGGLISGVGRTIDVATRMGSGIKSGFETAQIASMYAMDGVKSFGQNVQIAAMFAKDAAIQFGLKAKAVALSSAAWVKNTAVMVAQKTALVASTVATKAAAVAQRAFNLVLTANPIGLIITAVAALVAGLIWFFTQTELGQQIWANFTQFLTEAWTSITTFLSEAWTNITTWFTEFGTNLSVGWQVLWSGVSSFLSDTWANIKSFFASALQFVVDLFLNWTVAGLIIQYWDEIAAFFVGIWNNITGFIGGAIQKVSDVITAVSTWISTTWNNIWTGIQIVFSAIWNKIVTAAVGFVAKVQTTFSNVVSFVSSIPSKIVGFFSGIGSSLINSGRALIQGFLDGIMAGFNRARDFVSDGLANIRNLFPFSPAKEGPFSGHGWVLYSGVSLGETFTSAIATSLHDGRSEIADEMDGIEDEFARIEDYANGNFRVAAAVPDSGGSRDGVTNVFRGNYYGAPPREWGEQTERAQRRANRTYGVEVIR